MVVIAVSSWKKLIDFPYKTLNRAELRKEKSEKKDVKLNHPGHDYDVLSCNKDSQKCPKIQVSFTDVLP